MNTRTQQITQEFYSLHPDLNFLQEELLKTFQLLSDNVSYRREIADLRKRRQQRRQ